MLLNCHICFSLNLTHRSLLFIYLFLFLFIYFFLFYHMLIVSFRLVWVSTNQVLPNPSRPVASSHYKAATPFLLLQGRWRQWSLSYTLGKCIWTNIIRTRFYVFINTNIWCFHDNKAILTCKRKESW